MSRGMSKCRITNAAPAARVSEATTFGDYAPSSRGSSEPDAMDPAIREKIKDHPCFSREAHLYFARMHLAVAPACNIQCNYCNRKYDCANESRPGVASHRLTPDQALRRAIAVANEVPQLSVVGIAGQAMPATIGGRQKRRSYRSPAKSPTSSFASRPMASHFLNMSTSLST